MPFEQTILHACHICIMMVSPGLSCSSQDACGRQLYAGDQRVAERGHDAGNYKGLACSVSNL